jgi:preprotein translocase subunit Sec61beta
MSNDYSKLSLSPRGCLIIVLVVPIALIIILYVINLLAPGSVCCGGM